MIDIILKDVTNFINTQPFIFYLIGVALAYILLKWESVLDTKTHNWSEVKLRIVLSLFSWIMIPFVSVYCITHLRRRFKKKYKKNSKKNFKPPKWM